MGPQLGLEASGSSALAWMMGIPEDYHQAAPLELPRNPGHARASCYEHRQRSMAIAAIGTPRTSQATVRPMNL